MSEFKRSDIKTGMQVKIVLKEDQRTGKLTEGIVKTFSPAYRQAGKISQSSTRNKSTTCPKDAYGETGEVGRVKEILG
jgi:uncharacterized protein YwbE